MNAIGWSCDWTAYNSTMIAGMSFLAITGIVAFLAALVGACGTPSSTAPTAGAVFLSVLSFVCSIIGTVCAAVGVYGSDAANYNNYYRPGYALAIFTCILTFIFMIFIVALACSYRAPDASQAPAAAAAAPADPQNYNKPASADPTAFSGVNPNARVQV